MLSSGWRKAVRGTLSGSPLVQRLATRWFTRLYYYNGEIHDGTWNATTWRGVPVLKFPTDLWLYQELIMEVRPDLIIETGTWKGGSTLYFADLLDLIGQGEVVSVDVAAQPPLPEHPRITYLAGSSTDPGVFAEMERRAAGAAAVLIVLDSDHSAAHVTEELGLYSRLVTSGSYLVVEDGTVNNHPTLGEFGPGPYEAQEAFLAGSSDYTVDDSCGRYWVTNNPRGYLLRR